MPHAMLPVTCVLTQLFEIDRSIEVGGKELIMSACIRAENIDGVYGIKVVFAHLGTENIYHTWIEANGKNCGQTFLPELFT